MGKQSEQVLEDNLVQQLGTMGYEIVMLRDEKALLKNLKTQLEKHNKLSLSDEEFRQVILHLDKGVVFERAKRLRDRMQLARPDGDVVYIEFINQDHWCQNQFQVVQQVRMEGKRKNRYDVTILINGLPLVQIELKRRGLELKEAFNQINRYQRHSYGASKGLFLYVQLFVISNGVNTKYYANNKTQTFKQTFYWADKNNKKVSRLEQFAEQFLERCHLAKMITQYIVLQEGRRILMALRPYQYYATEAIVERVKNSTKNGYIWHTTGSGKTLTSFKASQILMRLPKIHKVVFVVDRKDLDYQTVKEFNAFSKGSIDATDNTKALVRQLTDETKLIVTTLQKLNTAVNKKYYNAKLLDLKDKKIVFIFDECHRSQFGETHQRIKQFFGNHQMFGFTGTPIFEKNAIAKASVKRTTKELFDDCLHKYVITDAIRDENVLKFTIEYVGRYKQKDDSATNIDINVEAIDTKELLESKDRLDKIADYIIANHPRKTHRQKFTGMFCVSSIDTLIKYYDLFKAKKLAGDHNLKVATIYSYGTNEDDKDANGFIPEETLELKEPAPKYAHSRDKLDEYIGDYNELYGTRYSTKDSKSFYGYYNDIAKRVKNKDVDVLLVVNMFLTGFDSPALNTLYVDKNLKYHGLIQAFSRTNRILGEQKSQGNIVCFRNLKGATDQAITLFSNKEAKETILMQPYEVYVKKFNEAFTKLSTLCPTVDSVDDLPHEDAELEFIKAFRELMRQRNVLSVFADFDYEDLDMTEQEFMDYKSKYLDLYDKVKSNRQKEKVSILDDVDFELELIHRDNINVVYILGLLAKLKDSKDADREKQTKAILDLLDGEVQLRSKRELIELFINEHLPKIEDTDLIPEVFEGFWSVEREKALLKFAEEEGIKITDLRRILEVYLFTQRPPLSKDIVGLLTVKPKIRERRKIVARIVDRLVDFVALFVDGI